MSWLLFEVLGTHSLPRHSLLCLAPVVCALALVYYTYTVSSLLWVSVLAEAPCLLHLLSGHQPAEPPAPTAGLGSLP